MSDLLTATGDALALLFSADLALWAIIATSFSVSLRAIVICAPIAILVAFFLAIGRFPLRRALVSAFNALMAVPAVVVGLTVYLLLSRSGPMGDLKLLFTQSAMVIGQILLSFPLLVAMSHAALQSAQRDAWETALTLGSKPWQAALTVMYEVRFALIAAVIAGFARVIAEVGCAMMVGGNILNHTRNITTAIALETAKGEFAQGIALGIVLLALAMLLNVLLTIFQGRGDIA